MTDGPLWASSLADRRGDAYRDLLEEPDEGRAAPSDGRLPALTWLTAAAVVLLTVALVIRDSYVREEVASRWGDVPMSCDTTRLERGHEAVELFQCRAVGGAMLPPGRYFAPEARWTSDITRADAAISGIAIPADGKRASGWALYRTGG